MDALNEKHGAHNFRRVFKSYEVKNTKGEITNVLDSRNRVMQLRKRKAKLRKVLPEHIKNLPQLENIFVVDLKPGEDVLSVAEAYQKDPNVVYAEPNYYFKEFLIPTTWNTTISGPCQRLKQIWRGGNLPVRRPLARA